MALTHNFKEGIDWVADPTGETPLAGFKFISKDSTSTEDGSPQNPYNTITAAIASGVGGITFVIGAGKYQEENLNPAFDDLLLGDGVVELLGDGTNTLITARTQIQNCIIRNYDNVFGSRFNKLTDCKIIDCNCTFGGSGQSIYTNTLFVNCNWNITESNDTIIDKCILINSVFEKTSGTDLRFASSHLDENSRITHTVGTLSLEYSSINGTYTASTVTDTQSIYNTTPAFNNKSGFDLSVTSSSDFIGAGFGGANIGNVFIAKGLFQGVTELDQGIDANVNLAYNSLGEIELQAGASAAETFETAEEEALELSVLGATRISGFIDFVNNTPDNNNTLVNPNQLILEINVALLDGIFTGWKEYRWNEQPTQNTDGTPNGDSSYNWADNNKVPYKKRKFRVTVRNDYNQA